MCSKYGWINARRQTDTQANHEKGSCHQNCQTEKGKAFEVGHQENVRKEGDCLAAAGLRPHGPASWPGRSSAWFLDETFEIPPYQGGFG